MASPAQTAGGFACARASALRKGATLSLLCFCLSAQAQLPDARISLVSPPGAGIGTTVTVTLTGIDVEVAELRFSHPGITATRDEKDPKKFAVTVPRDVKTGRYDVRAAGKFGVSNPRVFEITERTEVQAAPKATTRDTAQEIPLPCVVGGNAVKQGNQWFKVQPTPGKELAFECHAGLLDSRMDPLLILSDSAGRELARARNRRLLWIPTGPEPLYLCVRDFLSNGGGEHFYRLHAGPAAEITSEGSTPLVFWPPSQTAPPELEPNDASHAQRVTLPFEVKGEFFPARDADVFEFEAKKGEAWWVEITSNRLGAPTNPRIVIEQVLRSQDGGETMRNPVVLDDAPWFAGDPDFDGHHFDPIGKFEPKEDGVYRLVARDLNNTVTGRHERPYALSVRRPAPDFALVCAVLTPVQNKAYATSNGPLVSVRAANLRPGQVLPLRVFAIRRDGFDGAISLKAEGLPDGVEAEECALGSAQNEGILLLRAQSEARPWAGTIRIQGHATSGGAKLERQARMSTPVWESTVTEFVEPARSRFTSEIAVAVVDDSRFPVLLRASPQGIEAAPSEKVKIPVWLETKEGEPPSVKVKAVGLPGLEKVKETEIPAKDGKAEYELDLGPLKLAPGTHSLCFKGEQKTKFEVKGKPTEVSLPLYSNPVFLTIKEAKK